MQPPAGEVCLLQPVKIPAGYQRLARGSVDSSIDAGLLLFTPRVGEMGLKMADGAVEVGEDRFVTLVIQNHGTEPVRLEKGVRLGMVDPVELVTVSKKSEMMVGEGSSVPEASATVQRLESDPDEREKRKARLLAQLDLNVDGLPPGATQELETLLASYADVFALDSSELGTTDMVTHSIETEDHRPIRQPVRRTPFALRKKVDTLIQEMLEQQVIEPSESPWASPIVLVQKKDGGVRFCVDYRKLNRITKLDEFPLPRIDDTLDLLSGARYFTTLDLASGYWQVAMEPSSKEKTAFTTYSGLYQFKKMPFGLVNAPATFQRLMEVVLAGLARTVCLVYLDDILVIGKTLAEHNANLTKVLDRIQSAGLRLKPKKCQIAREEVEYLGHVVSAEGVGTDPKKLEAVRQYPTPTDVKTLRSFLGLTSYYRRFVPDFAKIAGPLHALTKKDVSFIWTETCQQSFETLKKLLTSAPVLCFPQFDKPFILETDASGVGLGAVLAQKQEDGSVRPIAYASRSLQPHERNYGITELEGLGVVWAVKHFRPYLYGHSCDVYTDHSALTSLLNTPQPSGKLARWGMAIQELDLRIHHRAGRSNVNADALSRSPLASQGSSSAAETPGVVAAIESEEDLSTLQRQDEELTLIIAYLETGVLPDDEKLAKTLALTQSQYTVQDQILYRVEPDSTLRVIPPASKRERLFQEAHEGVFGAHLSDVKVHSELRRHYWWAGMR